MFDSHTPDSSHALQDSQTHHFSAVVHVDGAAGLHFFSWSTVQDVVYNCCFNFGLQIYYRLLGATQPTEIMSTDQHETGLLKHTTPQLNVKLEIVLKLFNGVPVSLHCLGFACTALYAATAAGLCSRV